MTPQDEVESVPPPSAKGRLTNQQILLGQKHDPLEIIKIYSEDEWEQFVREWVEGVSRKYKHVRRAGGSRDKGRDVIGYVEAMNSGGLWDNFQCKHYDHALHPSDLWKELGKLCYYTFVESYSIPRAYYFVAPRGVGPEAISLLEKPESLKSGLTARWRKGELLRVGKQEIVLDSTLEQYVQSFDFSIIKDIPPARIIDEHRETRYYAARFGGGLVRLPPDKAEVPEQIASHEARFVAQILAAYGDHLSQKLETAAELMEHPTLKRHFDRQRTHFYLAELLRNFTRDNIPEDGCFERLQEAIYDGVIDTVEAVHQTGFERMKKTIEMARAIQIDSHPLKDCLEGYHRSGVCHQLANDDRLTWVP